MKGMVAAGCSMTRAETGVGSGVIWATVATGRKPDVSTSESVQTKNNCPGILDPIVY